MGLRKPYGRIGGKSYLRNIIINKLSEGKVYVEPFFGGGSVFFGLDKGRYEKEVINDLDTDVYTLMKGFKDYDGVKISEAINGNYTMTEWDNLKQLEPLDEFDKFIKCLKLNKLSYFNLGKSFNLNRDSISSNYAGKYQQRLANVEIHNKDYKDIIQVYDSVDTVFYLDPPYFNPNNCYRHQNIDMYEMKEILCGIKGKFVLSFSNIDGIKELFRDFDIIEVDCKYARSSYVDERIVSEVIIKNF